LKISESGSNMTRALLNVGLQSHRRGLNLF
jgi:hypothetical protein